MNGPHTVQCLSTIWEEAGCLKEGSGFPSNLPSGDLSLLKSMSLPYVLVLIQFNYN